MRRRTRPRMSRTTTTVGRRRGMPWHAHYEDQKKEEEVCVAFTFLDMTDISMLSFPSQPEMYTVESGSEASLPLKEHRVA